MKADQAQIYVKAGFALAALVALAACTNEVSVPAPPGRAFEGAGAQRSLMGGDAGVEPTLALAPLPADLEPFFDPNPSPTDSFTVVGALTPPSWSWGEIELLEGHQRFRTEGYNNRTEKLRFSDTFQSSEYPLQTYFGSLNQQLVDGFNLYYGDPCATSGGACPEPGPKRPEARFVLLHKGPETAAFQCDTTTPPVLLVHGAIQDGNVWLRPSGDDGAGNPYPPATSVTGFVDALEDAGRCTYAVTFGNFHGDNYNQAIQVRNAIARVRQIHGAAKVDVVAWSKGVLALDVYLANAATWTGFGSRLFERVAAAEAASVPLYDDDIRAYVALSGPHKGIDLNFRHPIHTLTIASTEANAPVGRGPMPWTSFAGVQCVTFGPPNPFLDGLSGSICEGRGEYWPDFFRRVHVSNVAGLDSAGAPVSAGSLETLNLDEGASSSGYSFDEYNMSLFGSIDDSGRWVSAYLGQLQAAYDLRADHPIPTDRWQSQWGSVDPDEERWFPWLDAKLAYNPYGYLGGWIDDLDHDQCRTAAFDPSAAECAAWHTYGLDDNAIGYDWWTGYTRYKLFDGLGIDVAMEMGGRFIDRLKSHGLDPRLESLYVLAGDSLGAGDAFETDGLSCPTCDPHGDGVLFDVSIRAADQLTQGWSAAKKAADLRDETVDLGHLEVGASPEVFSRIIGHFEALDGT